MNRYAVIRNGSECVNVIVWDGVSAYEPPVECALVALTDEFRIGPGWQKVDGSWRPPQPGPAWLWDGTKWIDPDAPEPDPDTE